MQGMVVFWIVVTLLNIGFAAVALIYTLLRKEKNVPEQRDEPGPRSPSLAASCRRSGLLPQVMLYDIMRHSLERRPSHDQSHSNHFQPRLNHD